MYSDMFSIPCAIIRGGTSKGVFLKQNEIPQEPEERDALIEAIFGSPDIRQIDGLGGADVLTSKVAIIAPSSRDDADIDYLFGQVGIDVAQVNFNGSCGNIASAVGPYAIDEGYVKAVEPVTKVRVHLCNNDTVLIEEVPVKDGKALVSGDYRIDGCPGTGARIACDWSSVVAQKPECLLPTGNVVDTLTVDGKVYHATITGVGNIVIFIRAEELGMTGIETPDEIGGNSALMDRLEKIRGLVAYQLGMVERPEDAVKVTPYQPFIAAVREPVDYTGMNGVEVKAGDVDLVSRLVFMQKPHKTYPISGATGIGAAACIPGTIVWDIVRQKEKKTSRVVIGHPCGTMDVESAAEVSDGHIHLTRLAVFRTARRIMDGQVYVKKEVL